MLDSSNSLIRSQSSSFSLQKFVITFLELRWVSRSVEFSSFSLIISLLTAALPYSKTITSCTRVLREALASVLALRRKFFSATARWDSFFNYATSYIVMTLSLLLLSIITSTAIVRLIGDTPPPPLVGVLLLPLLENAVVNNYLVAIVGFFNSLLAW